MNTRLVVQGFTPAAIQPSQEGLRSEAAFYHGECHEGLPSAEEWTWVTGQATIAVFTEMLPADWKTWFKAEIIMAEGDGREGYYDSMREPIHDPVIATITASPNGSVNTLVWDGYHRVGAMVEHGHATVPIILGFPLSQSQGQV